MKDKDLYEFLKGHGYSASLEEFTQQRARLKEQFAHEFKGELTMIVGESFFKASPELFKGCLFGDRLAEVIQEVYNAHCSNRIFDRRVMKTALMEMEAIQLAIDVHTYCHKTPEYNGLMADIFHRLKDHLPQVENIRVLKNLQMWVLRSMFNYFSIRAEYEAVRMALDLKEFALIAEHKATIKATRSTPYLEIYNQYEQCEKHIEDDYIFLNASLDYLNKRMINPPVKIKTFSLSRLRPTKQTIIRILEKQVIGNKPFFQVHTETPQYTLDEQHMNPYYNYQVLKLRQEIHKYGEDLGYEIRI